MPHRSNRGLRARLPRRARQTQCSVRRARAGLPEARQFAARAPGGARCRRSRGARRPVQTPLSGFRACRRRARRACGSPRDSRCRGDTACRRRRSG
ncbi:hypothetical protein F3J19_25365 [Burkholderia sp. Ax-1724]|nr:hypothetical protein [Burkholderia sp. Ax-1724]NIF77852.1 hypothetical protein [Paraburkholderia sp. Cy-641]